MGVLKNIWLVGLCLGLLASCKDEEGNNPVQKPETVEKPIALQANPDTNALPFAHTKTIKCVLESQDGTRKTTSSYLKYDPNTKDPITLDMLEYPDKVRQKRLNYLLEKTKITDARIELPLLGGKYVFTLVGKPYFHGEHGMTFHEEHGPLKNKTYEGFWFGKDVGNIWQGVLRLTKGDTSWGEGYWGFQAGEDPATGEMGPARCNEIEE